MPSRGVTDRSIQRAPSGCSTRPAASANQGSGAERTAQQRAPRQRHAELVHPAVELTRQRLGGRDREPRVLQATLGRCQGRAMRRLPHPGGVRVETQEGLVGRSPRRGTHGGAITGAQVDGQSPVTEPVGDLADVHLEEAASDHALHRCMVPRVTARPRR